MKENKLVDLSMDFAVMALKLTDKINGHYRKNDSDHTQLRRNPPYADILN